MAKAVRKRIRKNRECQSLGKIGTLGKIKKSALVAAYIVIIVVRRILVSAKNAEGSKYLYYLFLNNQLFLSNERDLCDDCHKDITHTGHVWTCCSRRKFCMWCFKMRSRFGLL
jgi:hypothetical protein